MIHADDEDGIRVTAPNHFCALLNRDQAGHARGGNALNRPARAVFHRQIVREKISLQMPPRQIGARMVFRNSFERLDVGFCGCEDKADSFRWNFF